MPPLSAYTISGRRTEKAPGNLADTYCKQQVCALENENQTTSGGMMNISLYDATVRGFIQTVSAVQGFMERGLKHLPESGFDLSEVVETRLFADMLPFRFQILSVIHHSVGAIEGAKNGVFSPPGDSSLDYAGLHDAITEASAKLKSYSQEEINALYGREVVFQLPNAKLPFAVEDFLLSFSIPNFHFHATTAYDILRMKGLPLGKRDYLGRLRVKR
jgi:uncharacterized protein